MAFAARLRLAIAFLILPAAPLSAASRIGDHPDSVLRNEVLALTPASGFHFGEKGPQICNGSSTFDFSQWILRCQATKDGTLEVSANVCDDKESCVQETFSLPVSSGPADSPSLLAPKQVRKGAPNFIRNDIPMALSFARTSNSLILIHFYSGICPTCDRLDESVLGSKQLAAATRGMIKVEIDGDSRANWEWTQRYKINQFPTLLLVNSKLQEIGRLVGFRSTGGMLRWFGDQQAVVDEPMEDALKHTENGQPVQQLLRNKRIGIWHYQRKEYVDAIQILQEIANKEARKYELLARRDLSLRDHDTISVGLALTLLLEEFQDDPDYGSWIVDILANDRDYTLQHEEQARRMLSTWRNSGALELTQWEPGDLYRIEAELLLNTGRVPEAQQIYRQAAAYYDVEAADSSVPGARGALFRKAEMLADAGDIDGAAVACDSMTKTNDDVATRYIYAKVLDADGPSTKPRQQRLEEALVQVNKAEDDAYGSNWLSVAELKARILRDAGKNDDARRTLENAISRATLPSYVDDPAQTELETLRDLLRQWRLADSGKAPQ